MLMQEQEVSELIVTIIVHNNKVEEVNTVFLFTVCMAYIYFLLISQYPSSTNYLSSITVWWIIIFRDSRN